MKVKMEHIFDVPVDEFDRLWNDVDVIQAVVHKLPNVKKREVVEEENKGDHIYRKVLYEGDAQIPSVLKNTIKPDMLKWYEYTKYYPSKKEYEFEMVPAFFQDKIRFKGKIRLLPEGKNKTRRIIEGELTINFNPLIKKAVEGYMKGYLESNMEAEAKVLAEEMSKRYSAKA